MPPCPGAAPPPPTGPDDVVISVEKVSPLGRSPMGWDV